MSNSIWRKVLSLALVLVLIFQMMPVSAFADDDAINSSEDIPEYTSADYDFSAEEQQEIYVTNEITELRDEREKHFRLSDGSFAAVEYEYPVHFQTADGSWEEIDNTLSLSASEQAYIVQAGAVEKSFAASLDEGYLLRMSYDGCTVELSLLESDSDTWEIQPIEEPVETEETTLPVEEPAEESAEASDSIIVITSGEEEEPPVEENLPEEEGSPAEEELSEEEDSVNTVLSGVIVIEADGDSAEVSSEETEEILLIDGENTEPAEAPAGLEESTEPSSSGITTAGNGYQLVRRSDITPQIQNTELSAVFSADESLLTLEEAGKVRGFGSELTYNDVFPGISLVYQNMGYNVKESIVITQPQESYSFAFGLNVTGLQAILEDNGSVSLRNSEAELIYSIPAPYMYDTSGELCLDVNYSLAETAGGYILTVTADSQWLNAADRSFPVVIDPTLVAECQLSTGAMTASYVAQGSPGRIYSTAQTLYFGYSTVWSVQEAQIYMGFSSLPIIPKNSVVVSSEIKMCQTSWSKVVCTSCNMGMYQVTDACPSSGYYEWIKGLCWNTKPNTSSSVLDYATCTQDTNGSYLTWNITRSVKEWYSNSSATRALAIKLMDISQYNSSYAVVATFQGYGGSGSVLSPYLTVSYRYAVGLEDYYTAHSHSIDRAGTGYVSDFTSNLTLVKNDVSAASTVCPVNISHIFNSAYIGGQISEIMPGASGYWSMPVGQGWKLNIQQAVAVYNDNYLQYLDADGTIHYFYRASSASNTYTDEDGLGLTITASNGNYTMTDRYGNISYFGGGLLSYNQDANGNRITYVRNSSDQVTSVTRTLSGGSAETVATLGYNAYGFLISITDMAGNTTSFSYGGTANNMRTVTHADGTSVSYVYDSSNRMNAAKDNESGYSMNYTYTEQGKVGSFTENGGGTSGASVAVSGNGGVRTYRYSGMDRTLNTSDDILTTMVFDNAGRTISSSSTSADKQLNYSASAALYSANSGTSACNNRLQTSSAVGAQSTNFVRDCGTESLSGTLNGYSSPWGYSGTGTAQSTTAEKRTGARAVAVTLNAGEWGGAIFQTVSDLVPGSWYVLSAYVNTKDVTSFGSDGGARMAKDGGSEGSPVNWNSSGVGDGWERIYVTQQADENGQLVAAVLVRDLVGTVYVDDIQVEDSLSGSNGAPGSINLLTNGSMSNDEKWYFSDADRTSYVSDDTFGRALKQNGDINDAMHVRQTIYLNQPGTQTYLYSGWARAESLPRNHYGTFHLWATVVYTDSSVETHKAAFDPDSTEWQYCILPIVPNEPTKTVSYITVELSYNHNANTVYFANACFTKEEAQSYKYNANGDLVSVSAPQNATQTYSYSGADLISQVTKGNGTFSYEYDSKHNVTKATNDGVSMSISYDARGNTTGTTLTGTNTSQKITSSAAYDSTGNYITSQTDARGNSVTYTYGNAVSKMTGQPTAITDPTNVTRTSTYNSQNGRITGTEIAGTASLDYAYSSGRLTAMTRGGFIPGNTTEQTQTYTMSYDGFGNMTGVSVGNKSLASYTYGSSNGQLQQMSYGNGYSVSYSYDNLERVSQVYYNGSSTAALEYSYTGAGTLGALKDNASNRTYSYTYDSLNRLTSMTEYVGSTGVQQYRAGYDDANRVTKVQYKLSPAWNGTFGSTRTYTYTYNSSDGSLSAMSLPGGAYAYSYDGLKRLSSRVLTVGGTTLINRQLGYLAGAGADGTTLLVSSLTNKNAGGGTISQYNYTYDALGNITAISGSTNATYTYDNQGQLLTECMGDTTWTYTYDTYGNLRSKTDGTTTDTYTYGDGQWLDLLTAYNGNTISYDAIGNPTTWYDGTTFTWANGRRLASATNTDEDLTVSYTYDSDGLRLTKTVGGVEHKYLWQGSKLVSECYGGKELEFFYDESGNPCAFSYKASSTATPVTYYYLTNLQGDIVGILDSSGNSVASYTYNAWGKLLSSSGDLASINPLRYRGYYYDAELEMYYLESRYYDPEICRIINADILPSTGQDLIGSNMFAYCGNNPISRIDAEGEFWGTVLGATLAGAIVGAASAAINSLISGEEIVAKDVLIGAAKGAVNGAIAGTVAAVSALTTISVTAEEIVKIGGSLFNAGVAAWSTYKTGGTMFDVISTAVTTFGGTYLGAALPSSSPSDSFVVETAYNAVTGVLVGGSMESFSTIVRGVIKRQEVISSSTSDNAKVFGGAVARICIK